MTCIQGLFIDIQSWQYINRQATGSTAVNLSKLQRNEQSVNHLEGSVKLLGMTSLYGCRMHSRGRSNAFQAFAWGFTFFIEKNQPDAPISQIYFVMELYMFRTVRLSIISSLFTVHSALVYMSYRFVDIFEQDQDGTAVPSWACSKPVWHIPLLSVQWINCWWWTEELSETCRVSWQNKFGKLMHLVGFITKRIM